MPLVATPRRRELARLRRALFAASDVLQLVTRARDPFWDAHRALVDALRREFEARLEEGLSSAIDVVTAGGLGDVLPAGELRDIMDAMQPTMTEGWEDAVLAPVADAVEQSYEWGRGQVLHPLGMKPEYGVVDEHAQKVLTDDTMYWIGDSWGDTIGPEIARVIREQVIEQGLSRGDAADALQALFGEQFPALGTNYWNVVAAAGTVRARTFGSLGSFEQAKVETYRFRSLMDARTSSICAHLNGRIFRVARALEQRDAWLGAEDPEEAKAAHPWPKLEHVQHLDTDALEEAGVMMPPLHGHCRSVIIPEGFAAAGDEDG